MMGPIGVLSILHGGLDVCTYTMFQKEVDKKMLYVFRLYWTDQELADLISIGMVFFINNQILIIYKLAARFPKWLYI